MIDTWVIPLIKILFVLNATLISSAAAVCIDQAPIPADTNDMGAFPSFFAALIRVYGRANLAELFTLDAGFCSEANARLIDDAGKAYWISLKDNQPELKAQIFSALHGDGDFSPLPA